MEASHAALADWLATTHQLSPLQRQRLLRCLRKYIGASHTHPGFVPKLIADRDFCLVFADNYLERLGCALEPESTVNAAAEWELIGALEVCQLLITVIAKQPLNTIKKVYQQYSGLKWGVSKVARVASLYSYCARLDGSELQQLRDQLRAGVIPLK